MTLELIVDLFVNPVPSDGRASRKPPAEGVRA
jgi:hypothetical protein